MDERWAGIGSTIASLIFIWTVVGKYLPEHMDLVLAKYVRKLVAVVNPYVQIRFPELSQGWRTSSPAYLAIESYVASICTDSARRLMADMVKDSTRLSLKMDDKEEVADTHDGAKLWWCSTVVPIRAQTLMWSGDSDVRRYYTLTFHRRDRELIQDHYLPYVMERGRAFQLSKRQRKLYTNSGSGDRGSYGGSKLWSHVPFEHPATFDTIAMEPEKKQEILEDLDTFRNAKDYYATIGKAWKRGYLLHGPPGTGKSSLVAAMANLLDYDVYDIELTAVKDNTSLRRLLIETASKSIIVIEDIDCSLDLTGQRKEARPNKGTSDEEEKSNPAAAPKEEEPKDSKVTLSGLLNFIDGLWSACGSERLIVFTTNYIEKLDPALIRRGRMDKHIELSYCGFESFKVLAKNYLRVSDHPLFEKVRDMMADVKITPADVAENLMPKRKYRTEEDKVSSCLEDLIKAMVEAEAEAEAEAKAKAKAEEDANLKAHDLEEAKAAAEAEKKGQEDNDDKVDVAVAKKKSSVEKEEAQS